MKRQRQAAAPSCQSWYISASSCLTFRMRWSLWCFFSPLRHSLFDCLSVPTRPFFYLPVCFWRHRSCVRRWTSSCSGVSTTTSACGCMPYWPWRGCGAWLRCGQGKGPLVWESCPPWSRPVWTRRRPCRAQGESRTAIRIVKSYLWYVLCIYLTCSAVSDV